MASRVFLDANVLLDFTLKRRNYDASRQMMKWVVGGRIQGFITPAIVHIVGYWLTRAYGSMKAKELLLTLLSDVAVIDISHDTAVAALHSRINDIEDALQYYAALSHKLDYFISEDKVLHKVALAALPVYNTQQFIRALKTK